MGAQNCETAPEEVIDYINSILGKETVFNVNIHEVLRDNNAVNTTSLHGNAISNKEAGAQPQNSEEETVASNNINSATEKHFNDNIPNMVEVAQPQTREAERVAFNIRAVETVFDDNITNKVDRAQPQTSEAETVAFNNTCGDGLLNCLYINADSLPNKLSELRELVRCSDTVPMIIAITEVKPKNLRFRTSHAELHPHPWLSAVFL